MTTKNATPSCLPKNVACIGAGYVGAPTMAVLAKHCPETKFVVADINKKRIDSWNSQDLPIYEPQLKEYIEHSRDKNLFFTTEIEKTIKEASIIFIAVNTPTKDFGHWGGSGYDLSAYEAVSRSIAMAATDNKIIVEKSTVPVRTAERIRNVFQLCKNGKDIHFEVLSNPEFLAEGTAINDLENPDRVLIGGSDTPQGQAAVETLSSLYKTWLPSEKILTTRLWSAELSKLVCNAFLAQRVSSINSISALCESTGADVEEVAKVLGTDSRIGPKFLKASVGFGGSCFGKDLIGLIYLCETFNLPEVANYWRSVLEINQFQKIRLAKKIVQTMFDNVKGKDICIYGFAFKKNTSDFRESAALDVIKFLLEERANIFIYDPKVPAIEILQLFPSVKVIDSPYQAVSNCHAIVVLTEWDEFKTLDYNRIYSTMSRPSFIFDGRNILDHKKLEEIGFQVSAIGKSFVKE